jgi:hypothetical protein
VQVTNTMPGVGADADAGEGGEEGSEEEEEEEEEEGARLLPSSGGGGAAPRGAAGGGAAPRGRPDGSPAPPSSRCAARCTRARLAASRALLCMAPSLEPAPSARGKRGGGGAAAGTGVTGALRELAFQRAPEPRDVDWENVVLPRHERAVRGRIAGGAVFALVLSFAPLVSAVSTLASLESLANIAPPLASLIASSPLVVAFLNG